MNALIKKNDLFGTLFSDMFDIFSTGLERFDYNYPRANTSEDDENYKVDVYYPGLKKENFKVGIDQRTLTISSDFSESKEENNEKYHFKEFSKKEFRRMFTLPDEVIKSKIKASYEDGVLKVVIPKDKVKEKQSKFEIAVE